MEVEVLGPTEVVIVKLQPLRVPILLLRSLVKRVTSIMQRVVREELRQVIFPEETVETRILV